MARPLPHVPPPDPPDHPGDRPFPVLVADEPPAPEPQTAAALAPPPRLPPGLVGAGLLPPSGGYPTPGIPAQRSPLFGAWSALLFTAVYVLLLLTLIAALLLRG